MGTNYVRVYLARAFMRERYAVQAFRPHRSASVSLIDVDIRWSYDVSSALLPFNPREP
jgi:hypothetical protein